MGTKSYPVIDMAATGRNICHLRMARGLSVSEMQEYFGFDAPQAIYKWQQGKSLPSIDNFFALSRLLGVPMDEILVPRKPIFQILPQEESCGDHFFGWFSVSTNDSMTRRAGSRKTLLASAADVSKQFRLRNTIRPYER